MPAGASEPADEVAISAGRSPIVRVKAAVVDPEVMVTELSPERSLAGIQDQLPLASAVAETDWLPIVPETEALAVVIPENVGLVIVTQNWVAP